jgi:hypothetical protein
MVFPTRASYANFLSTWKNSNKLIMEVNTKIKFFFLILSLDPLLIGGKPRVALHPNQAFISTS